MGEIIFIRMGKIRKGGWVYNKLLYEMALSM